MKVNMNQEDQAMMACAMAVHHDFCDRKHEPGHQCVGSVTINRGSVYLSCELCGHGTFFSKPDYGLEKYAKSVIEAAGLKWESLTHDARVNVMRVIKDPTP